MNSDEYASFRKKLIRWYSVHGRDLPWRKTRDPYKVWISEIMLQQTTVAAVIPYFERFIGRCPTVKELAIAEESEILRLWEGLGYYSRARNIHRTARLIVDEYAGIFPTDLAALQSLPGIGRYTAGAIASFSFDQRAPIVEANTLRLYCRLLDYDGDPRSSAGQEKLWEFAAAILPRSAPGQFNQALMELGATICSPRDPMCGQCPVSTQCSAFANGSQATVPRPKERTPITAITEVSVAIRHKSRWLLRRRGPAERWAGLWDFVRFEVSDTTNTAQIIEMVNERTGLVVDLRPQIAEWKHAVTRYRITLRCFTALRIQGRLKCAEEWAWVEPATFAQYPLSVTARQFADKLSKVFD